MKSNADHLGCCCRRHLKNIASVEPAVRPVSLKTGAHPLTVALNFRGRSSRRGQHGLHDVAKLPQAYSRTKIIGKINNLFGGSRAHITPKGSLAVRLEYHIIPDMCGGATIRTSLRMLAWLSPAKERLNSSDACVLVAQQESCNKTKDVVPWELFAGPSLWRR